MTKSKTVNKTVFELLKQELFREEVKCGPDLDSVAYFPFVRDLSKKDLKGVKHVIPQEGFHPQVAVAIDFNHTFVQTLSSVARSRLIDEEILASETKRLAQFVKRYFENVYAFGGGSAKTKVASFTDALDSNPTNSLVQNKFLNEIINYLMTDISVQRGRTEIGSANITFKDNKNLGSGSALSQRALTNNALSILEQLFVPMLPIRLWSRGRMYSDYYFPIFDGYITSISFNDAQGFAEIQLQAKDVLELARFSHEMTAPSLIQQAEKKQVNAINILGKPFYGHNHVTIVTTLLNGGNLTYDGSTGRTFKLNSDGSAVTEDNEAKATAEATVKRVDSIEASIKKDAGDGVNLLQLDDFEVITPDKADLRKTVLQNRAIHKDKFTINKMVELVQHTHKRNLIIWGDDITPYRIWNAATVKTFESAFSSRLDILREVAGNVYYELYVDGAGNVHYHPQRFANKFLKYNVIDAHGTSTQGGNEREWPGVNVLGPEEITSIAPSLNFEELVTFLKLTGKDPVNAMGHEIGGIVGSAVNKKYISRFGYRRDLVNNPMFNINVPFTNSSGKTKKVVNTFGNIAAAVMLIYRNAELFTKEATIIHRPELMDLAEPVYYTDDDTVFYINTVNHTVSIGGDAVTSMNCSFGRKYAEPAADLQSFIIMSEKVYKTNGDVAAQELLEELPVREWQDYLGTEDAYSLEYAQRQASKIDVDLSDNFDSAAVLALTDKNF